MTTTATVTSPTTLAAADQYAAEQINMAARTLADVAGYARSAAVQELDHARFALEHLGAMKEMLDQQAGRVRSLAEQRDPRRGMAATGSLSECSEVVAGMAAVAGRLELKARRAVERTERKVGV